jgi:hypothetical protein
LSCWRPTTWQLSGELDERFALLVGEGCGAGALELGELSALALEVGERLLERAFQCASNEPVLGLAGVVFALGAVGLVLGALEREPLPREPLLVLVFELTDRAGGRGDPGRRGRL